MFNKWFRGNFQTAYILVEATKSTVTHDAVSAFTYEKMQDVFLEYVDNGYFYNPIKCDEYEYIFGLTGEKNEVKESFRIFYEPQENSEKGIVAKLNLKDIPEEYLSLSQMKRVGKRIRVNSLHYHFIESIELHAVFENWEYVDVVYKKHYGSRHLNSDSYMDVDLGRGRF